MKTYNVIGYGSLISHKSLSKKIPNKHFKPVIVKNYKRIFNLAGRKTDYLNIIPSKNSKFNGVMFKVTEKELIKLKDREVEYNLEPIYAYDFKTKKKLAEAFLFIDSFLCIDNSKRKPNEHYLKLCREAAYHISKEFGKFWDETTFTADGKKISEIIKSFDKIKS